MKIGDIVLVLSDFRNLDWNQSGATKGKIIVKYKNFIKLELLDKSEDCNYNFCHVHSETVVTEIIYNSPLYKALEENK